jgi:hypothetical protein
VHTLIAKFIPLAIVTLIFVWGCQFNKSQNIPDELVGIWVTADKKYKDRYIEFRKDALIIGTGQDDQPVQPIRKLKVDPQNGKDLYTVTYLDPEGGENLISFFYDLDTGVITLKNQRQIAWEKTRKKAD